jgi:hypothetical protein
MSNVDTRPDQPTDTQAGVQRMADNLAERRVAEPGSAPSQVPTNSNEAMEGTTETNGPADGVRRFH